MVTSAVMVCTSLENAFGWKAHYAEQLVQMMLVFENSKFENGKESFHLDLRPSSDDYHFYDLCL